jgi:VanZ family protein
MSKIPRKLDTKSILLLIAVILWMALIFYLSSFPADNSAQMSGIIARSLLRACERLYGGNPPAFITDVVLAGDHFVRKAGHIIEFFILGILVGALSKRLGFRRNIAVSIAVCFLYAVSDEIHQAFVPGRGPLASDVLLDTAAAALAVCLTGRRR